MGKKTNSPEVVPAQVRVPANMSQKLAWLKAVHRDRKLRPSAKNVAFALFTFHNAATGRCHPKQATIAEAAGMKRDTVNGAIQALVESGWISTVSTGRGLCYVLHVEFAVAEEHVEIVAGNDNGADARCRENGTADVGEPGQQMLAERDSTYEPSLEPSEGTTHNTAPVEQEVPAVDLTIVSPAPILATSPDNAAPAIGAVSSVVKFAGLTIPAGMFREWEAAFKYVDLQAAILKRTRWLLTKVPESRRLRALETELGKMNEEARIEYLERKERRQKETERTLTGKQREAVNPRHYIPHDEVDARRNRQLWESQRRNA